MSPSPARIPFHQEFGLPSPVGFTSPCASHTSPQFVERRNSVRRTGRTSPSLAEPAHRRLQYRRISARPTSGSSSVPSSWSTRATSTTRRRLRVRRCSLRVTPRGVPCSPRTREHAELGVLDIDARDMPGDLCKADGDRTGPTAHVEDPIPAADRRKHEVGVLRGAPVAHQVLETHDPVPLSGDAIHNRGVGCREPNSHSMSSAASPISIRPGCSTSP